MQRSTGDIVKQVLIDCLDLRIAPSALASEDSLYGPPVRLDSLAFHRTLARLEAELGVRFDEDELAATLFDTVGDLIAFAETAAGG